MRDVAGAEIAGDFAGVEFVLQRYLDGVAGKGYGAQGSNFRADAGNTGDEEVCFPEVEIRREGEGGD